MKKNKGLVLVLLMVSLFLGGCSSAQALKLRLKLKNNDFEYIKEGIVEKIVIQSTRDKGFKFVVTDENTIDDLYGLLSRGKVTEKNTELEPDYIFEIQESADIVHRFYYVAGVKDNKTGNFYNDESSYSVSKRLDNDIISNMSYLTKPRDFQDVYYQSILKFIDSYGAVASNYGSKSIGINLEDDVDLAKYILSVELEDFEYKLKNTGKNVALVKGNKEDFDVLVTVKSQGYKTTVYRSILTVFDKKEGTELKYYIRCDYKNRSWTIVISEDSKPSNW